MRTSLDRQTFRSLLLALSTDPDEAGRSYETTRSCLIRFFENCQCLPADELADETFDRIARRLHEGVSITDVRRYALGVARRVASEHRKRARLAAPLPTVLPEVFVPEEDPLSNQLDALETSLARLPGNERELVLSYFRQEGTPRHRRQLSVESGLSRVALRVRVHRIRKKLEVLMAGCQA